MRAPRSRWLPWLALALAVAGVAYSVLGLAMTTSFYAARPVAQHRIAAYIYLAALGVAMLVAAGAIVFLFKTRRTVTAPQPMRD